jgi:hypothetical protein
MALPSYEENFAAFIGPKADFYLEKWRVFASSEEKISWNWSAFLFSYYWMMYRKMYVPAVAAFVVARLAKYIVFAFMGSTSAKGVTLLAWIGIGLIGNWLYYQYATQKIEEVSARMQTDNPTVLVPTLQAIGGVSSWAWVIVLAILGKAVDKFVFVLLLGHSRWDALNDDTMLDM